MALLVWHYATALMCIGAEFTGAMGKIPGALTQLGRRYHFLSRCFYVSASYINCNKMLMIINSQPFKPGSLEKWSLKQTCVCMSIILHHYIIMYVSVFHTGTYSIGCSLS